MAALRAGNRIGAAGAALLAPSLGRMTQLTSLDLGGTLRDIGGWRRERVLANAGIALMMMRVEGRVVARGAVAGAGVCEGRVEGRRRLQTI